MFFDVIVNDTDKKILASSFSLLVNSTIFIVLGLPGKESTCQCRRFKFDPWVRKIPWKRKCPLIPVFLPGKFHGQRNPAGYSPWSHKESDTTDWATHAHTYIDLISCDFLRLTYSSSFFSFRFLGNLYNSTQLYGYIINTVLSP